MFLRRNRRTVDGQCYEYWTLVRTVRTAKGPRQEVAASLGKEPGLDIGTRPGWDDIANLLEGREPAVQGELGQAWPRSAPSPWAQVDVSGVHVERVREFGQVYLALALWRRLGLHQLLKEQIPAGREDVPWELTACVLTVARFCGQRSELEVAERWYADSALGDLLGVPWTQVNDARLYRGLDVLHAHREKLCSHLLRRYQDWFGVEFEFLLYDVTSTYIEGQGLRNAKAARGYSRDHRPDCKQVNIGFVVTPEGLPIGYEVFAGNTADVTTVEDMVELMESKYGQAKRIWVMDRGMISEDNIDFLREKGAPSRHAQEPAQAVRSPAPRPGELGGGLGGCGGQARAASRRRRHRTVRAVSLERPAREREGDDRTGTTAIAGPTGQRRTDPWSDWRNKVRSKGKRSGLGRGDVIVCAFSC